MADLGTRSICINSLAAWGVTTVGAGTWALDTVLVKIPGFGAFSGGDTAGVGNIIKASRKAIAGTAATLGQWTLTVAGTLALTPSTVSFVVNYKTLREEALGARLDQTPGRNFPFTVKGDTAILMAAAVKAQMDANPLFMSLFTVTVLNAVITLTAKNWETGLTAAYTGFAGAPYAEDRATGREIPGVVTGVIVNTVAAVGAKGLGADLAEDEFLATAYSVQPYGELITDQPIPGSLYHEIYFDIALTNQHSLHDAPSIADGRRGYSIYVLASDWDGSALNASLEEAFGNPA